MEMTASSLIWMTTAWLCTILSAVVATPIKEVSLYATGMSTGTGHISVVATEDKFTYLSHTENSTPSKAAFSSAFNIPHTNVLSLKHVGIKRHTRTRRGMGYRTKCTSGTKQKKVCMVFTVNGVTKPYCITVNVKDCTALD